MFNQICDSRKLAPQAEQAVQEVLRLAAAAHRSVVQAQIGLTGQEIEYAHNQVHEAINRVFRAQQSLGPESKDLSAQLKTEHEQLLWEYQLVE